jgi:hypothetical protein
LFEDMAIAHWLVLHREDPDWLVVKFGRHVEAMRLHEAEVRERMGAPAVDDVSALRPRADALRREFGRFAQRDWWGEDRSGARVAMPELVKRLADAPQFQPG